jgi:hypothetical protein
MTPPRLWLDQDRCAPPSGLDARKRHQRGKISARELYSGMPRSFEDMNLVKNTIYMFVTRPDVIKTVTREQVTK